MAEKIYWKKGVSPRDLQLVMRKALLIVHEEYSKFNKTVTVTCTGDGAHKATGLHSWGYAFDVRTFILTPGLKKLIYDKIKKRFANTPYQIIFEKDHFHIEYDPADWKETF